MTKGRKSYPRTIQGQHAPEVKGPLLFFSGASLTVPQALFTVGHSFDRLSTVAFVSVITASRRRRKN